MSVSSRVIKKKGAGNASLEVLPQDQPTSPKSCDALAQSSKSPAGSALEVLPPETSLSSSMILPPTSPCVAAAAPPKQPGPTGPTASLRKVNTAPVRRIPVTPPKAHPFAPAPGAPRAVTSAGSPGSPAGAGTFNRKRTGRGIQEAKEFCVEMGTGGPLEGGAPGEGDGDGDGGSDGSGEGLDPELLDDLEQSSLLEDPGTPAAAGAGAGPGAPATPRLTARDINTIMDPSTLDFLAKNRDTLSKYMAMERSVASGASSAASTPLSGAPRARPDWAFITRVSQMSRLAASDRDDALTVASVSSAAPSPAASPHPVVVRKASGASSAAPTLASPPSTASVPSQGSALLPEPPKESQFPEGGAKDEAEEAELGSVHPLPDTFDASFSDAHFMDGDSSLCEAGACLCARAPLCLCVPALLRKGAMPCLLL